MDVVNDYLERHKRMNGIGSGLEWKDLAPLVTCRDGFHLSVQASYHHYCQPRDNNGPYSSVEVGYPSAVEPTLLPYAEEPERPTDTVYGCVPVDVVCAIIEAHGGIAEDPEGGAE